MFLGMRWDLTDATSTPCRTDQARPDEREQDETEDIASPKSQLNSTFNRTMPLDYIH